MCYNIKKIKLKYVECNRRDQTYINMLWDRVKRLTQKTKKISLKKWRYNKLLDQLTVI